MTIYTVDATIEVEAENPDQACEEALELLAEGYGALYAFTSEE